MYQHKTLGHDDFNAFSKGRDDPPSKFAQVYKKEKTFTDSEIDEIASLLSSKKYHRTSSAYHHSVTVGGKNTEAKILRVDPTGTNTGNLFLPTEIL